MKYSEMHRQLVGRFRIVKLSQETVIYCRVCNTEITVPRFEPYQLVVYRANEHHAQHIHESAV